MNTSQTGQRLCHAGVMKVAKEAAANLYESMMSNDGLYKAWKKQNPGANDKQLLERFVERNWGHCLDFARSTLTEMLKRPDIAEEMKDEIMVILEQDYTLRHRRVGTPPFRQH